MSFCGNWSCNDAPRRFKKEDVGYCRKLSRGRESGLLAVSARGKRGRINLICLIYTTLTKVQQLHLWIFSKYWWALKRLGLPGKINQFNSISFDFLIQESTASIRESGARLESHWLGEFWKPDIVRLEQSNNLVTLWEWDFVKEL